MATYPNQMQTYSATGQLNKFDLSFIHQSTNDFGIMQPIASRFLVPGDKISVDVSTFTRMLPMPCPTNAKIDIVTRAFFVPLRTIFKDWEDYLTNTRKSTKTGLTTVYPLQTTVATLTTAFVDLDGTQEVASNQPYDIKVISAFSGTTVTYKYYQLHGESKRIWAFFQSLGLNFTPCTTTSNSNFNLTISLFPLLAFWRLYLDWIVPARWVKDYYSVQFFFTADFPQNLTVADTKLLLRAFYSYFDDDLFTSAFTTPFSTENEGQYQNTNAIQNPASAFNDTASAREDTTQGAVVYQPDGDTINAFTLKSVGVLQDMINRGRIAGSKIQDYLLTEFGLRPNSDTLDLSVYLGSRRDNISIGDVMSQAGTDQNALGEFAGVGRGFTQGSNFEYETKEHGYIFFTSEILLSPSYTEGIDMMWRQSSRYDFFSNPELDNLGMEPIDLSALHADWTDMTSLPSVANPRSVFGWTPRFAQAYKTAQDRISGDFRLHKNSESLRPYYLTRQFPVSAINYWKQVSNAFIQADCDKVANDYDYIFNQTSNADGTALDHFLQWHNIRFTAYRPMLPISTALEATETSNLGKPIEVSINNGVQ